MNTKTLSPQLMRKRKFLIVLPLLVLPFLTLMFWALGGGKGSAAQAQEKMPEAGLNMQLPDATLKEDGDLTKLSYYERAAADSARLEELMKSDPYYLAYKGGQQEGIIPGRDTTTGLLKYQQQYGVEGTSLPTSHFISGGYTDPNEARVYQKLQEINTAMNTSSQDRNPQTLYKPDDPGKGATVSSQDIDRLEKMMEVTQRGDGEEDPEIKQLSEMMDKIMDIQHPERVKQQLGQASQAGKGQVFAVRANNGYVYPSLLESYKEKAADDSMQLGRGFFSLEEDGDSNVEQPNTIRAVIHETQTALDGSTIKLRLLEDVSINKLVIPNGSFVFGRARLQGERLNITISSVRYQNLLLPVSLSVVDLDGIEGIHIPSSITREIEGNSTDRVVQSIGATTLDPSLGAQAAGAGIEAAKTLLAKKTKAVKVTLKGGYQVLLIDDKQNTSW